MPIDEMQIRGLAIMLAVALIVMLVFLRGQKRAIWWFALALVAVGLGYLATTEAPRELGGLFFDVPDQAVEQTTRTAPGAKPAQ
jgi:hypothetical protein